MGQHWPVSAVRQLPSKRIAHHSHVGCSGCSGSVVIVLVLPRDHGAEARVVETQSSSALLRRLVLGALDGVVRDRMRMALNGHITVTVIIDENDEMLGDPWCELMGLADQGKSRAPLVDVVEEDLSQLIGRSNGKTMRDDKKLEEAIKRQVRQSCNAEIGKKPEVTIVVSRLA